MAASGEPPSGKVTFLVTDIKDSSGLSRRQWDTSFSKAVLKLPLETIREIARGYQGCAFKDTGDGLLIVFKDPQDALKCAVRLQERFGSSGIHISDSSGKRTKVAIRIGIHSTSEDLRPQPSFDEWQGWDYKGEDVGLVCRVGDVGEEAQIFVSNQTYLQLRACLLCEWKGWRTRLKGFGTTKVWECLWDGKSRGAPNQKQRRIVYGVCAMVLLLLVSSAILGFHYLQEIRQRSLDRTVANGLTSLERGDTSLALLWFVEGLRLAGGDPSNEFVHRMRIGSALREHPKLLHSWFLDGNAWFLEHGSSAGFNPDRNRIVTTGSNARVWDVASGRALTPAMQHSNGTCSAVFSPDGLRVLTASPDGYARVWSADTGQPLAPLMHHPRDVMAFHAIFSPDGKVIATVGGDVAQLWDPETGIPLTEPLYLRNVLIRSRPRFSRDGQWLVVPNTAEGALVWGVPSGRLIATLPHPAADCADFAPDGSRIVVGGFNSFRVWQTSNWVAQTPEIQFGAISEAMFSPDAKRLLIGASRMAVLCDAENPQVGTVELRFKGDLARAAFSPDSKFVAIASNDSMANRGEVSVWQVQTGSRAFQPLQEDAVVDYVEFSSDNHLILTASSDKSGVNGNYIIAKNRHVRAWRLPSNEPENISASLTNRSSVKIPTLSPDGAIKLTCDGPRVQIQDRKTGRMIAMLTHTGSVRCVQFSLDGKKFATACDVWFPLKGEVRIWESNSGKPLSPVIPQPFKVGSLVFNSVGSRVLVACGDIGQNTGEARIWDVRTGKPLTPPMQLNGYLQFASFDSTEQIVVTTGFRAARLWDARTGLPVTPVLPHPNSFVSHAEFEPGGSHLLTSCVDPPVKRWDVSPDLEPIPLLIDLAQMLSGKKIDAAGAAIHLRKQEFQQISERWKESLFRPR